MVSLHHIAEKWARTILFKAGLDGEPRPKYGEETLAVVTYGLEVALGALGEVAAVVGAGALLKVFPEVMAAFLTQAMYRLGSGGAHCTAYYRCLISSLVALLLIAGSARYLEKIMPDWGIRGLTLAVTLVALAVVARWAPADTPANPITNPLRRRSLRRLSFLFLAGWTNFVLLTVGKIKASVLYASIVAVLLQTVTVTPLGYRLIMKVDRILGGKV
ncbi:MAG: accessory gene regulator B family protein [Thermanaeromonas sp.]|uniref:accessory gene regulator ArgB-like protein n=1 Tax=Thermanaeromonas sp. TaxID=2003697 RepID=UPI0024390836|nr:accessory gene regulator B family protein [Thermanaeromonas sp.]MCG0276927.1 accessory gene regulator B family protein [Thermanaeromonas sp.]